MINVNLRRYTFYQILLGVSKEPGVFYFEAEPMKFEFIDVIEKFFFKNLFIVDLFVKVG